MQSSTDPSIKSIKYYPNLPTIDTNYANNKVLTNTPIPYPIDESFIEKEKVGIEGEIHSVCERNRWENLHSLIYFVNYAKFDLPRGSKLQLVEQKGWCFFDGVELRKVEYKNPAVAHMYFNNLYVDNSLTDLESPEYKYSNFHRPSHPYQKPVETSPSTNLQQQYLKHPLPQQHLHQQLFQQQPQLQQQHPLLQQSLHQQRFQQQQHLQQQRYLNQQQYLLQKQQYLQQQHYLNQQQYLQKQKYLQQQQDLNQQQYLQEQQYLQQQQDLNQQQYLQEQHNPQQQYSQTNQKFESINFYPTTVFTTKSPPLELSGVDLQYWQKENTFFYFDKKVHKEVPVPPNVPITIMSMPNANTKYYWGKLQVKPPALFDKKTRERTRQSNVQNVQPDSEQPQQQQMRSGYHEVAEKQQRSNIQSNVNTKSQHILNKEDISFHPLQEFKTESPPQNLQGKELQNWEEKNSFGYKNDEGIIIKVPSGHRIISIPNAHSTPKTYFWDNKQVHHLIHFKKIIIPEQSSQSNTELESEEPPLKKSKR